MAVNLTITLEEGQPGPYPGPDGMICEDVKIVGATSVANDTGTYTTKFIRLPSRFRGSFNYSFSGQVMTLTDKTGIGTATQSGTVVGYA